MTKDEALRLALEALEKLWNIIDDIDTYSDMAKADEKLYRTLVERRQRQRFEETGISTDGYELHGGAITAIKAALEAKDEPADNELRRLHDLLGKANALARIRAAEIESLKASLYGHYELEKQYDELKQRLTKTEAQLGEAVWNYGELKREQLANQQNTSGSPIFLELHCICGAEWEWRNRDWELVATPPQRKPLSRNQVTTMAFGAYIRKKREEKDIQLNYFAKLLDISPAYWSRIERELEKPPKDELIRKAAEHLGLDVDDAFVEASRLPPDMRENVGDLVRMYRRQGTENK